VARPTYQIERSRNAVVSLAPVYFYKAVLHSK
jgi:hypothetical protein